MGSKFSTLSKKDSAATDTVAIVPLAFVVWALSNRSGSHRTLIAHISNIKSNICAFCKWVPPKQVYDSFFYAESAVSLDSTRQVASVSGHRGIALCGEWFNPRHTNAEVTLKFESTRQNFTCVPEVGLVMRPNNFDEFVFVPKKGEEILVASQDERKQFVEAKVVQCREDGTFDVQYEIDVTPPPEKGQEWRQRCRQFSYEGGPIETSVTADRVGMASGKKGIQLQWLLQHGIDFDSEPSFWVEFEQNVETIQKSKQSDQEISDCKGDDEVSDIRKADDVEDDEGYDNEPDEEEEECHPWKRVTMTFEQGIFSYFFDEEKSAWGEFPIVGDVEVFGDKPAADMHVAFAVRLNFNSRFCRSSSVRIVVDK